MPQVHDGSSSTAFVESGRDNSGYGLSQWEKVLNSNTYSYWPYPECSLDWWMINHIGSVYGLVPSGLKPSLDVLLTQTYNALWLKLSQAMWNLIGPVNSQNLIGHFKSCHQSTKRYLKSLIAKWILQKHVQLTAIIHMITDNLPPSPGSVIKLASCTQSTSVLEMFTLEVPGNLLRSHWQLWMMSA